MFSAPPSKALSFALLLFALPWAGAGCGGPNSVDGAIAGSDFGKARDAVFVGDLTSDDANLRLMISNFEDACQNYKFYAENQQYDADNDLADPDEPAPRYLLFTVYLPGVAALGTWPILPAGQFYEGSMSFISGRYSEGDGVGQFDPTAMDGGALTFDTLEADTLLGGTFTADFTTGDTLEGAFEATYCTP